MSDDNCTPTFEHAMDVARRWHYGAVRRIADYAIAACAGVVRPVDPDVRSIWRDALAEGREDDAHAILVQHPNYLADRERPEGRDAREFLSDYVREACDDHQHVIHPAMAGMVLACSDNSDALENELGADGHHKHTVEARACWAMMQDVWDVLEAREDEWTDPPCEGCGDASCTTREACAELLAEDGAS